jgi:hypothetical protein
MKYETAGDPITGLKWTRRTVEKIAEELRSSRFDISPNTVGKILENMGYSLKCNSKKISNGGRKLTKKEKIDRNAQFEKIQKLREAFESRGLPVISVDTKKKELVGNFKNDGTRYKKDADLTNDHDFHQYGVGKAFPYGIYDPQRNEGYVYVGRSLWIKEDRKFSSSETPEFAVENISKWWKKYGREFYPTARKILIQADSGGSNSYRSYIWKHHLYEQLCLAFGLEVTVCHLPPGASKWNLADHRLFSEISKNWRGTPLVDYETILKYIRTTKTKTGLSVQAHLVTKNYEKGKTVSKEDFKKVKMRKDSSLPNWNYTLMPN